MGAGLLEALSISEVRQGGATCSQDSIPSCKPFWIQSGLYFSISFSSWPDPVEKATSTGPTHTACAHMLTLCVTATGVLGISDH